MTQLTNTRYIRLGDLFIDPAYQRDLDRARVERYAQAGFDQSLFQPLVVSLRADGRIAVIDGSHRHALVVMLGWDDDKRIPCVVMTGLTLVEEAELFVQLQRQRRPLSAYDLFKADLTSRDPEAVSMQAVLQELGLRAVNKNSLAPDGLRAVHSARTTLKFNGADTLRWVLQVGLGAWPHDLIHGLSAPSIDAITCFTVTHASRNHAVQQSWLIKVCSKLPATFARVRSGSRPAYQTAAAELVQPYNKVATRMFDRLEILPVNAYTKRPRRPDATDEAEVEETA